jgi:hypothetical protein
LEKIGANRLAVAIDQAVGQCDPAGHRDGADAEQDQANSRPRGGQPLAGSQRLPEALARYESFRRRIL